MRHSVTSFPTQKYTTNNTRTPVDQPSGFAQDELFSSSQHNIQSIPQQDVQDNNDFAQQSCSTWFSDHNTPRQATTSFYDASISDVTQHAFMTEDSANTNLQIYNAHDEQSLLMHTHMEQQTTNAPPQDPQLPEGILPPDIVDTVFDMEQELRVDDHTEDAQTDADFASIATNALEFDATLETIPSNQLLGATVDEPKLRNPELSIGTNSPHIQIGTHYNVIESPYGSVATTECIFKNHQDTNTLLIDFIGPPNPSKHNLTTGISNLDETSLHDKDKVMEVFTKDPCLIHASEWFKTIEISSLIQLTHFSSYDDASHLYIVKRPDHRALKCLLSAFCKHIDGSAFDNFYTLCNIKSIISRLTLPHDSFDLNLFMYKDEARFVAHILDCIIMHQNIKKQKKAPDCFEKCVKLLSTPVHMRFSNVLLNAVDQSGFVELAQSVSIKSLISLANFIMEDTPLLIDGCPSTYGYLLVDKPRVYTINRLVSAMEDKCPQHPLTLNMPRDIANVIRYKDLKCSSIPFHMEHIKWLQECVKEICKELAIPINMTLKLDAPVNSDMLTHQYMASLFDRPKLLELQRLLTTILLSCPDPFMHRLPCSIASLQDIRSIRETLIIPIIYNNGDPCNPRICDPNTEEWEDLFGLLNTFDTAISIHSPKILISHKKIRTLLSLVEGIQAEIRTEGSSITLPLCISPICRPDSLSGPQQKRFQDKQIIRSFGRCELEACKTFCLTERGAPGVTLRVRGKLTTLFKDLILTAIKITPELDNLVAGFFISKWSKSVTRDSTTTIMEAERCAFLEIIDEMLDILDTP